MAQDVNIDTMNKRYCALILIGKFGMNAFATRVADFSQMATQLGFAFVALKYSALSDPFY